MRSALSAELSALANCCRWPRSPSDDTDLFEIVERPFDWSRFDTVMQRDRVTPLVHHALNGAKIEMPPLFGNELRRRAHAAAKRSLVLAGESLRLQQSARAEGIPAMILKGVPLAALAYGNIGYKESLDIDFLVPIENARTMIGLLHGLGYESEFLRLSDDQVDGYLAHCKEATFIHRGARLMVDLHWGLVDVPGALAGIDVHSPAQEIAVPGGRLRTLADEELFTYLCVHGSLHNWARLKWLADLSAFLDLSADGSVDQLYLAAERFGAQRAASIALKLRESVLGFEPKEPLRRYLKRDRITRVLSANAFANLNQGVGGGEHGRYSLGWLRKIAAQLFVAPGVRNTLNQIRFYWNYPIDRLWLSLPRRFWFLYHVIRAPMWLVRLVTRAVGALRT